MTRLSRFAPFLAVFVGLTAAMSSAQAQHYHVTRQYKVGGEGGWDYLVADTGAHRVFLSRGTHVMVVDADRDTVLGDIPNTTGVHGIALVPALGKGFTSNGRDSSLTVFDYRTLATTATIKIPGANPDAIIYEPTTNRVFTFNGRSHDATAIDAKTNAVVGTIALPGKPEAANYDGKGNVYVNIEDSVGKVTAFDAKSLAVKATWTVDGCEEPSGQGIDRQHELLFLACANNVMAVVHYTSGHEAAPKIPIGPGTDGAAFDEARHLAFSTNGGDGTLTVIRQDAADKYTVIANVPTQRGARTIALDPRTHRVYTVSAEFGPAPAPTADQPRPRRPMVPGTFTLLALDP
ncbi:MAG TPA: YncE family protein [Gemmatimonadaceae bacterium]|nr:YncE family protein [Gemmatimonadaceae bacterium]